MISAHAVEGSLVTLFFIVLHIHQDDSSFTIHARHAHSAGDTRLGTDPSSKSNGIDEMEIRADCESSGSFDGGPHIFGKGSTPFSMPPAGQDHILVKDG